MSAIAQYLRHIGEPTRCFDGSIPQYRYGSEIKSAVEQQLKALGYNVKLGEEKPLQPDAPLFESPLSVRNYANMTRDQLLKSKNLFEKLIAEYEKLAD